MSRNVGSQLSRSVKRQGVVDRWLEEGSRLVNR